MNKRTIETMRQPIELRKQIEYSDFLLNVKNIIRNSRD